MALPRSAYGFSRRREEGARHELDERELQRCRDFDRRMDDYYFKDQRAKWLEVFACCRETMRVLILRMGLSKAHELFEESDVVCPKCGIIWSDLHGPSSQRPPWETRSETIPDE